MEQSKQIAIGVTFLVCCIVFIWLVVAKLTWQPVVWPPEPDPYIAMVEADEEEFIPVEVEPKPMTGNEDAAPAQTPEDIINDSQIAPQSGVNLSSQGPSGQPQQIVTQQSPSPAKEVQKPTTPKPANPVDKKAEEEKALAQKTQNTTSNAFANALNKNKSQQGSEDNGPSGRQDGNPDSSAGGNASGTSLGIKTDRLGGGWSWPPYSRSIPSNEVGSVTFEISINADGSVAKVTQISNTGLTSRTITACRNEIMRHKFKNSNMANAQSTTGSLTFTFQDPK